MGTSSWLHARLRGDRLMLLSGALMVFGVLAFAVNLIHPVLPDALLWVPTPASGTCAQAEPNQHEVTPNQMNARATARCLARAGL